MTPRRVAVIGAGMAGLGCALRLTEAGVEVWVFDKGRVPGGRVASRRLDGAAFDHGAQFVTARDDSLDKVLDQLAKDGATSVWDAASTAERRCWVGVPAMSSLPARLAGRLVKPPEQRRHVSALHIGPEGWRVRHHPADDMRPGTVSDIGGDVAGPFDAVLLALPSPQAVVLLDSVGHEFAAAASRATYAPCWTVMACFAQPLDLPDMRRSTTDAIGWIAREASRPGRHRQPERFVFQASAAWSRAHLELTPAEIMDDLLSTVSIQAVPLVAAAHRWRYSMVEQALGSPCLWDAEARLGACGDWCLGGRVEAAWQSGEALAEAVLSGGR